MSDDALPADLRDVPRSAAGTGPGRASDVREAALSAARAVPTPEGIEPHLEGPYRVTFARDAADLERVQRLRFEVFNRELGEGFAASWETGLDADPFDAVCHHLMLEHAQSRELVGTYRMQTPSMASEGIGLYCAGEFDLGDLPREILEHSVELGRACIAREHRNGLALFALWRGLASYLTWSGAHSLFGCCSLTSLDARDGARMMRLLEARGHVHPELRVEPLESCRCDLDLPEEAGDEAADGIEVPKLFSTYLRYGAHVLGPPAMDREFGTIDFFLWLDVRNFGQRLRDMFFSGWPGRRSRGDTARTGRRGSA